MYGAAVKPIPTRQITPGVWFGVRINHSQTVPRV